MLCVDEKFKNRPRVSNIKCRQCLSFETAAAPLKESESERNETKSKMLKCQQSTVGTAGFQRSLSLKAGLDLVVKFFVFFKKY